MGDTILIVTGGLLQIGAVQAAKAMGLRVVVTDRDPACLCAELADEFYPIDIYDVPAHIKLAKEIDNLRAVFTTASEATVTVAETARSAGLHGIDPIIAMTCRSKGVTRIALPDSLSPKWDKVQADVDAIKCIVREMGPAIVKAQRQSGGRGHTQVSTADDVTQAVIDRAGTMLGQVLVEELLTGEELSVETLWYNGEMIPLSMVERPFAHDCRTGSWMWQTRSWAVKCALWDAAKAGFSIELGHYNPAVLSASTRNEVWDVMERAGIAIGMHNTRGGHIFKGDLILPEDGPPKVLELTVRLSGNFDSGLTSPLAHGVDYISGAISLSLGNPPDWSLFMPRCFRHAACINLYELPGKVKEVVAGERRPVAGEIIQAYEDQYLIVRSGPGDTVPSLTDYAALVGYAIGSGGTREEAIEAAATATVGTKWVMEEESDG